MKEDYNGFSENSDLQKEFVNASDRVVVIMGAAALDTHLEKLLRKHLINDSKAVDSLIKSESNTPLSSFAARISAAYCLGLISENDYKDLLIVKKIRNEFAHELSNCNFDNGSVKDRIGNLIMINDHLKKHPPVGDMSYRIRFIITIYQLDGMIKNKIQRTTHLTILPNTINT